MERPLLTYLILAYNQEAFIREAIESAFAQTYSPLEIIISDDGSRDRTFEIASEMAAGYRGRHRVRLNRNDSTRGIAGHVNRAMELRQGALVVVMAGDDVALPGRTETIYQAWEQSGRTATSIFSSYKIISSDGVEMGLGGVRNHEGRAGAAQPLAGDLLGFVRTKTPVVNGCTHAWSPKLFDYFGPLRADLEDLVLSFRSLAVGQLLYIHEPLIKYRRHGQNVSFLAEGDDTCSFEHREQRLRWVDEKSRMAYENILADLETLHRNGDIRSDDRERCRETAERIRDFYQTESRMMSGTWGQRVGIVAGLAAKGQLRAAGRFLPRALPRAGYRLLFEARSHVRSVTGIIKGWRARPSPLQKQNRRPATSVPMGH